MDTSRVALALARTRLMASKFPYYLLADSPEGIKKEAELTGKIPPEYKTDRRYPEGLRLQARPAHNAQVHRQQPGYQRGHVPRGD